MAHTVISIILKRQLFSEGRNYLKRDHWHWPCFLFRIQGLQYDSLDISTGPNTGRKVTPLCRETTRNRDIKHIVSHVAFKLKGEIIWKETFLFFLCVYSMCLSGLGGFVDKLHWTFRQVYSYTYQSSAEEWIQWVCWIRKPLTRRRKEKEDFHVDSCGVFYYVMSKSYIKDGQVMPMCCGGPEQPLNVFEGCFHSAFSFPKSFYQVLLHDV